MQGSQCCFKQVGLLAVCPTGKGPLWAGLGGSVEHGTKLFCQESFLEEIVTYSPFMNYWQL